MSDKLSPEQIEEINQALIQGKKIAAIKIYRDATGQGLKEAKDFIEALISKLMEQDPEKFAHLNKASGCAGMILLTLMASLGVLGTSLVMDSTFADTPVKVVKQQTTSPGYDSIEKYSKLQISDWQLIVHRDLIEKEPELWKRVEQELKHQFYQIHRRVPAEAVKKLKLVTIWVELQEGHHPGLVYHPNPDWLSNHNMNPKKAGCVEIASARNFVNWSLTQPYCILHEMAHAWHHQQMPGGHGNKEVSLTLERAKQRGLYGPVLHIKEKSREAYAGKNPMEYFAESTEAFFGTNDFYPFVRSELRQYDPEMHDLLARVWGVKK